MSRRRTSANPRGYTRPGPPCPACVHDQRNDIDLAIARGVVSRAEIGRRYGLDRGALYRHVHGGHLPARLLEHAETAATISAEALAARIARLLDGIEARLDDRLAETDSEDAAVARLSREWRGLADVLARVLDLFPARRHEVTVTGDPSRWSDGEVVAVLLLVLDAVDEFGPEVRERVGTVIGDALAGREPVA